MHNYSGSDVFPANLQLIDDSDNPNATNFGTTSEGLGNRTKWLFNRTVKQFRVEFLASGTFIAPVGCLPNIEIEFCGGGGGGGGGRNRDGSTAAVWLPGGGGGGGALLRRRMLTVSPGDSVPVAVGAAGLGGASQTNGGDGGDSIVTNGAQVRTARGGQGGHFGAGQEVDSTTTLYAYGGAPVRGIQRGNGFTEDPLVLNLNESAGGFGANPANALAICIGNPSPEGFTGGAAGSPGSDVSTYKGGGPGGGGGAGPFGAGGTGGSGGNGNANPITPGIAYGGGNPLPNSGAGGGGGGSTGSGATAGTSGFGGDGGTGRVIITYYVYGVL